MTRFFLVTLFLLLALPHPAMARASAWQQDSDVRVRLISGIEAVGNETSIPLGLEIELSPDWHTYWRSPGEAGMPPQIDWTKSQNDSGNLKAISLYYPAPKRYSSFGMETIGYRDHVILPLTAELRTAGKGLEIDGKLDLLVCNTLCVPKSFTLILSLPTGEATPSDEASLLNAAWKQVPQSPDKAKLHIASLKREQSALRLTLTAETPLTSTDIFIENEQNISFAAPLMQPNTDPKSVSYILNPSTPLPEGTTLANLAFTLTAVDGERSVEQKMGKSDEIEQIKTSLPQEAPKKESSLFAILIIALIGGFILNLMPCVLPVLSLKILHIISHGGNEAIKVRRSFLATSAGILASFFVLSLVAIGMKQAGLAVGWGIQFQQPAFLFFLFILVSLFAANLLGLFEISLPSGVATKLASIRGNDYVGDFFSGALATLLATPCSAPFLGTAIGFALAADALEIILIFLTLGFGMALPFIAIALRPQIATAFPKPGSWMTKLRRLLGVALVITALWLGWIFVTQLTTPAPTGQEQTSDQKTGWQKFNPDAIDAAVASGKTVYVNITANWCITCKVNKKLVLDTDEIRAHLFNTPDVIAMQADWTSPDPAIAAFLKKHGRYGIPFDAVFGPAAPTGTLLPELLTSQKVQEALDISTKTH